MSENDIDEQDMAFCHAYANLFFNGAYQHCKQAMQLNETMGTKLSYQEAIEYCTHAGSAAEMLVYGNLAEHGNLESLWENAPSTGHYFSLPFTAVDSPNIQAIMGHKTRSIARIYDDMRNGKIALMPEHPLSKHHIDLLNQLRYLRNKAVHENILLSDFDTVECTFGAFHSYILTTFNPTDKEYQAFATTSEDSPFKDAETDLFRQWVFAARRRYANQPKETKESENHRLLEEQRRIDERWHKFLGKQGYQDHCIREKKIISCPICGRCTFKSTFTGSPITFWNGIPDNSPSTLFWSENTYLESSCCVANDSEAMHWTDFEIALYNKTFVGME